MSDASQAVSKTATISSAAELSEAAMALVRPETHPREYIALLLERELYPDAVKFLAHALPKREAVWWAWISARRAAGEKPAPPIKASLDATEHWIAQPTDPNRRAAMAEAEKAGFDSAAGCAGLGAFFSGGSVAPPELAAVPPGEYHTARAVAGAVTIAAVSAEPEKAPEKFRSFVAQGLDVAERIQLWGPKQT